MLMLLNCFRVLWKKMLTRNKKRLTLTVAMPLLTSMMTNLVVPFFETTGSPSTTLHSSSNTRTRTQINRLNSLLEEEEQLQKSSLKQQSFQTTTNRIRTSTKKGNEFEDNYANNFKN
eukprot:m.165967 g.165967  ORF g.165967 m.165967 type:complete len:117 (-) comp13441_c3_seq18:1623-1973(-)